MGISRHNWVMCGDANHSDHWVPDNCNPCCPPQENLALYPHIGYHTCGLRLNSTPACWGRFSDNLNIPPSVAFSMIAGGGYHNCGLVLTTGAAMCWGHHSALPPLGAFAKLIAGWSFSCGLRQNGTVACWHVKEGERPCNRWNVNGICIGWAAFSPFTFPSPTGVFQAISASWHHACGININGEILCWGDDASANIPPMTIDMFTTSTEAPTVKDMACGSLHAASMLILVLIATLMR